MRVAITGGTGLIGRILVERLDPGRFALRALGRGDADVTDLRALEHAFTGTEAVLHLAANAHVGAEWDALVGPNLIGAYHAFEAARRAGVRRVVFASSNHAVGMYLHDAVFLDRERPRQVEADAPVRPDSLYGATKAWGEALGRFYAERHGLEVICLRIGWVTAHDRPPRSDDDSIRDDPELRRRAPAMWLSHRDCASLVSAALSAAHIDFAIVNGVSDNSGRWLGLDHGRRLLGWTPEDGMRSA